MNLNNLYNQMMEKNAQDPKVESEQTEEQNNISEADIDEALEQAETTMQTADHYVELGRELARKDAAIIEQSEKEQVE